MILDGQRAEGLAQVKLSTDAREALVKRDPNNAGLLHDLMIAYSRVGDLSGGPFMAVLDGDDAMSLTYYKKALAIAEQMVSLDSRDATARADLATANMRTGLICLTPADRAQSIAHLRKAVTLFDELLKQPMPSRSRVMDLATSLEYLGRRLGDDGETDGARRGPAFDRLARDGIRLDARNITARVQLMSNYERCSGF